MKKIITKYIALVIVIIFTLSCNNNDSDERAKDAVYVKPSIDRRGRFRKGYVRMPVSTRKNAVKNQNRSRYDYHTRGKYRKKKY